MIRLVRAFHRHAKVIRLLLRELGQFHAELIEVQPRHFLLQLLRQHRDRLAVLLGVGLELSCDVPLLVPAFVRQMRALAEGYDVAVMEIDGFTHPLSAVYSDLRTLRNLNTHEDYEEALAEAGL